VENIKHFICDKLIVTIKTFKRAYDKTDLDIYKLISNSKELGYFEYDGFDFQVVYEERPKKFESIEKVKALEGLIKPYTKIQAGRKRFASWIFTDEILGEPTSNKTKKHYVLKIDGKEYTPYDLTVFTGLNTSTINKNIAGRTFVKLNGVGIIIATSDKKSRVYEITTIKSGKTRVVVSLSEMNKYYSRRMSDSQYKKLSRLEKDESMELPKIIIERIR
jgi:hypothetical protein